MVIQTNLETNMDTFFRIKVQIFSKNLRMLIKKLFNIQKSFDKINLLVYFFTLITASEPWIILSII